MKYSIGAANAGSKNRSSICTFMEMTVEKREITFWRILSAELETTTYIPRVGIQNLTQ
jgi:hypothetical protein